MDSSPVFRHKTKIQIRFKDIDALGHVNNANHVTYFEIARVKYFNEVINEEVNWSKWGIILAHMEIDYKVPVLFNDEIYVYSRVSRFGSKSFEMDYRLVKIVSAEEHILATGKSVQVCFNYENNETIAVPETWKEKSNLYESSEN